MRIKLIHITLICPIGAHPSGPLLVCETPTAMWAHALAPSQTQNPRLDGRAWPAARQCAR